MIRAEHLTVRVGRRTLLDDVDLTIEAGECVAVLGPNGAGKSTLLGALCGHPKELSTRIHWDDTPLSELDRQTLARRRAVVTQQTALGFPFTVEQIVLMGRNPHVAVAESAADHAIAGQALARVDADGLADHPFPTLSGGEKQRTCIARALAQIWDAERPWLLLDEPTSALDLRHQHLVMTEIKRLTREREASVVCVLHDMNLAMQYADKVLLLKDGKRVAFGETAEVLTVDAINEIYDVEARLLEDSLEPWYMGVVAFARKEPPAPHEAGPASGCRGSGNCRGCKSGRKSAAPVVMRYMP